MISKRIFFPFIWFVIMFSILLTGCAQTDDNTADATAEQTNDDESLDYVNEFDKNTVMKVEITVDSIDWQSMLDHASDGEYTSADVTINGNTIKNVGIKPKGNSSLKAVVDNNDSDRYSFKIKFDKYVDGQTWMGLDKIVLNNNYSDPTSMKEYLSYDIMRSIDVDSPLFSYANISVNGENWGFYLAVEVLDGSYLDRTKNGEGELYKPDSLAMDKGMADGRGNNQNSSQTAEESKPENSEAAIGKQSEGRNTSLKGPGGGMQCDDAVALLYSDDDESSYASIFDNTVTKTDSKDHQRVITAIKNLNEGTSLEEYVDVDAVLRYLAAQTVVVNMDSYNSNMGHNYYLYENNGQISMLPWDYNMAFGGFQINSASDAVNFPIDTPVSGVSMEERPMIFKLLEQPDYQEKYHQYLKQIIDGYFSDGRFQQRVDDINAMISDYIQNDPSVFFTYEEYQASVKELKKLGTLRDESIRGQLDGTIPSTTEGQQADSSNLIDASSVDMSVLGDLGQKGNGGGPGGMNNEPRGRNGRTGIRRYK